MTGPVVSIRPSVADMGWCGRAIGEARRRVEGLASQNHASLLRGEGSGRLIELPRRPDNLTRMQRAPARVRFATHIDGNHTGTVDAPARVRFPGVRAGGAHVRLGGATSPPSQTRVPSHRYIG
jgi:hypothetical protein